MGVTANTPNPVHLNLLLPMGYHVTILRTEHGVQAPLQLDHIKTVMAPHAGWRFVEGDQSFIKPAEDGEDCVLWFEEGELWTKSPSEQSLAYMIEIAKPLQARVRGDEFETYESLDKWYVHPDDAESKRKMDSENNRVRSSMQRRRWIFRACAVAALFFLGAAFSWIAKR